MNLVFDPAAHTYRAGDKVIPSVTQIIPKQDYSFVNEERMESARERGIRNHKLIEQLSCGVWPDHESDEELDQIIAMDEFLKSEIPGEIIASESPLYSQRYRFAGTPDLVFETGILDRKESAGDPRIRALQLAGYWILAVENGIIKQVKKPRYWILTYNGKPKVKNVYSQIAETVFLGLVQSYHGQRNFENYMKVV